MRKPNILVLGSFMMDLIAVTKQVPNAGETVAGIKFQTAPGGKGANQAVQCARLGAHVTMVGQIGGDSFGQILVDAVKTAGVDVSHVLVDPNESSGVGHITLEVTDHGSQNRITVCPGANFTLTTESIAWLKEEIHTYDLVMMQFELPMTLIETVAQWAYDAGVAVMVNPAPAAPVSDNLLSCSTYLAPNEHEAAALTGHPIHVETGINMEDIQAAYKFFQARGVKNLIITLGEHGSIIANSKGIRQIQCVKLSHAADPTAAGDSFVASFCTGLCAGMSQEQALEFASYAAALTVSRMGAIPSLPTVSEVQSFMQKRCYTGFDLSELDALK